MNFKKLIGEFAQSNTFVLTANESNFAFLVDAGASVEDIKKEMESKTLKGILLTHGHFDHINNLKEILDYYGYDTPIYLHQLCKEKLFDSKKNLSQLFGLNLELPKDKIYNFVILKDGDMVEVFDKKFEVLSFNGHSNCSLCFKSNQHFIVGDVVFETGVGRYDFEKNGLKDTIKSLERFLTIDGYKTVLSGHGEESTYDRQQRNVNSFLNYLKKG